MSACSSDDGSGASGGAGSGTSGSGAGGSLPTAGSAGSGGGGSGAGGTTATGGGSGAGGAGGSGRAGAGGVAGGSGGGGGSSDGGLGCSKASLLCENFNALAEGGLPVGMGWLPRNCFDAGYQIGAEGGQLLSSNASTSANSCALVYDMGTLTDFWVSASVTITGKAPTSEHEVTFFELGEKSDADDPELRIGYRGDNSCNNMGAVYAGFEIGATKGPGGEFTGCTGTVPAPNMPYCLEVHVVQGSGMLTAELHSNGTKLSTLVHSMPQEKIQGTFEARYLKVGMQSYGGVFDGLSIDNLSVSTTRVGCGE